MTHILYVPLSAVGPSSHPAQVYSLGCGVDLLSILVLYMDVNIVLPKLEEVLSRPEFVAQIQSFTAQYAEALLRYFDGANGEKPRDRRLWQHTKDMLDLTRKYPDDLEAAVLFAEALLALRQA